MTANTRRPGTLLLATHNAGKIRELRAMLPEWTIVSARENNLPEPEETGHTFSDNALIKAQAAYQATGLPSLADDSGFCVDALNGAPGIFSARWAAEHGGFAGAMTAIHTRMTILGTANRKAWFTCALAYVDAVGVQTFTASTDGLFTWPARGENGFGYDPAFTPDGHSRTFAEMIGPEKQALSHRKRALDQFLAWISG